MISMKKNKASLYVIVQIYSQDTWLHEAKQLAEQYASSNLINIKKSHKYIIKVHLPNRS